MRTTNLSLAEKSNQIVLLKHQIASLRNFQLCWKLTWEKHFESLSASRFWYTVKYCLA